jgi:hypothetical protein
MSGIPEREFEKYSEDGAATGREKKKYRLVPVSKIFGIIRGIDPENSHREFEYLAERLRIEESDAPLSVYYDKEGCAAYRKDFYVLFVYLANFFVNAWGAYGKKHRFRKDFISAVREDFSEDEYGKILEKYASYLLETRQQAR